LKAVDPASLIFKTENSEFLKYYSGVSRFQQNYNTDQIEEDLEALKAIG
jgi:hypothetical protein